MHISPGADDRELKRNRTMFMLATVWVSSNLRKRNNGSLFEWPYTVVVWSVSFVNE